MSPDGRWIGAIEGDRVALLDRKAPQSASRMLEGHRGDIKTVRFSRDSQLLVTASVDRTARVWRVDQPASQPQVSLELTGHSAALSSAAFSRDARRVATSSADNTIRIWDAQTGQELATLNWHGDAVNEVQFDPNGPGILSASDDGTVKFGRCEACDLSAAELRERVREQGVLAPDELPKIEAEGPLVMRYFKLPWTRDNRTGSADARRLHPDAR